MGKPATWWMLISLWRTIHTVMLIMKTMVEEWGSPASAPLPGSRLGVVHCSREQAPGESAPRRAPKKKINGDVAPQGEGT